MCLINKMFLLKFASFLEIVYVTHLLDEEYKKIVDFDKMDEIR